jgi:hypothetical protein
MRFLFLDLDAMFTYVFGASRSAQQLIQRRRRVNGDEGRQRRGRQRQKEIAAMPEAKHSKTFKAKQKERDSFYNVFISTSPANLKYSKLLPSTTWKV